MKGGVYRMLTSNMPGNRFLTGFMRFVTGHATGMTGAEGVDVAVLMFFVF